MKICLFLPTILIAMLISCQSHKTSSKNYQSVQLAANDSTFVALKDAAQARIQIFIDSLKEHVLDTIRYRFCVKSNYVENDQHEHMWARIYAYRDSSFKGIFTDSGSYVRNIHYGDSVTIKLTEIDDWQIEMPFIHRLMRGSNK